MRTIRFRAKKADGEWAKGSLIIDRYQRSDGKQFDVAFIVEGLPCVEHPDNNMWTAKMQRVNPDTIGQDTTLRDKNGKEIYAGDIIYSEFSDGSNCHGLVGWNDEEACFGLMDEYEFRSKQEGYDFPKFDSYVLLNFRNHGTKFEVVGNIHDNPELIKQR